MSASSRITSSPRTRVCVRSTEVYPSFSMNVRCSPGGKCKLDRSLAARGQVFAVDPERCALGLRGHLKHRHLASKGIAPTARVRTVSAGSSSMRRYSPK